MPNKESRYGDASRALAPKDLLRPLRAAIGGFQRLADLEISGRTMMTFMRGHMAEARQFQEPYEYFSSFYNRMGREFLQFDDYDFVVHHCVRSQFWHIKEELDLLQGSALGRALRDIGAPLPELTAPTTPGRRPPVAHGWYDEVYRALEAGVVPAPHGARNAVMPSEDCVMRKDEQLDRIWPQFLIWCGETWGRQIIACWDILRSVIGLRRLVGESSAVWQIEQSVAQNSSMYGEVSAELSRIYEEWSNFHAGTVDVHDPMYDATVDEMFRWARDLAPEISVWGIKDVTKDEMYLELAATVLALRGQPVVTIPAPAYWRRTQFVPSCNREGAPGMPPFDAAQ